MADDNITIEAIKKYLKNNPQEIDEFKRIINDEQNLIKEKKNDNITLLIKFEQSGKTKIILDNIKKNKKTNCSCKISIIITDNNTLLKNATTKRSNTENIITGRIGFKEKGKFRWKKYKSYDSPEIKADKEKSLPEAIKEKLIESLVVCGNKVRFEDINNIIIDNPDIYFDIYIDEADKTINKTNNINVNDWLINFKNVINITLITATPYDIIKTKNKITHKWLGEYFDDDILLFHIPDKNGKGYTSLDNVKHIPHDLIENSEIIKSEMENINKTILEGDYNQDFYIDIKINKKNIIKDYFCSIIYQKIYLDQNPPKKGEVWMIPGSCYTKSHDEIEDLCFGKIPEINSVDLISRHFDCVIKINGTNKTITMYNEKPLNLNIDKKDGYGYDKEFNEWLTKWFNEHDGNNLRIAITGNICISRGITISSKTCKITHLLVNNDVARESLSNFKQLISRSCGYCYYDENTGTFNYPTVICPQTLWNDLMVLHKVYNHVIDKAMSSEENDRVVNKSYINNLIKEINQNLITKQRDDSQIHISLPFDTTHNISSFLLQERGFQNAGIKVNNIIFNDTNRGSDGYMYPKRNVPGHTRNEHGNTFLIEETYKTKFVNNCGGSFINRQANKATGQCFMIYPVYKNSNSDPNDFKYYVHSLIV